MAMDANWQNVVTVISIIRDIFVTLGLVCAGLWALYMFYRRREAASLDVRIEDTIMHHLPLSANSLLAIHVRIRNTGKGMSICCIQPRRLA